MPRHDALIVLPTLAFVAWFSARGVVELCAPRLDVPRSTTWALPPLAPRARLELARLERLTGVPTVVEVPMVAPAALRSCATPHRLLATLVDRRAPVRSFAAIVGASGRTELLEAGDVVGPMRLAQIDVDAVVVEENGVACVLPMFDARPSAPSAVADAAPIAGVRTIDEGTVEIDRAVVERLASDPTTIFGEVRAIPHEEGGRVVGYRLYGIRSGSLTHAIGLRSGDTVRAIDGTPASDVGALLALAERLRRRALRSIRVEVERRGETRTMELHMP